MNFKKIALATLAAAMLIMTSACERGDMVQNHFGYDPTQYITLGQYQNLVVEQRDPTATEKEIQEVLDQFIQAVSTWEEPEGRDTVKNGDKVVISYTVSIMGSRWETLDEKDQEVVLGEGVLYDDLEKGIIGMTKGQTKNIMFKTPSNYEHEQLQNKHAEYTVTVTDIKEKNSPQLTDALVAEKTGKYNTVEEYKAYIKETVTKQNEKELADNLMFDAWEAAVANATMNSYPRDRYEAHIINSMAFVEDLHASIQENLPLDTFIELYFEVPYEEYIQKVYKNCEVIMKDELVALAIAQAHGITLTWDEYRDAITPRLAQYDCSSISELEKLISRDELVYSVLSDKVANLVVSTATTKYVPYDDTGSEE